MKSIIAIIVITLLGKIMGFLREVVLARYFGTGYIVDAYIMSITIPTILFGFLPALGAGFTPVYFTVDTRERDAFTLKSIISSVTVSTVCALLCFVFADLVVGVVAPGFQEVETRLTVQFLRAVVWYIILNTPVQIMIAYMNCRGFYVYSSITNLALSSSQCVGIVLAARYHLAFLPLGILFAFILQLILLFVLAFQKGFRPSTRDYSINGLKALYAISIPIFLSNILVDLSGFIDKYLASYLREGRIASLNYAYTIMTLFYAILMAVVTTIYYPVLSSMIEKKNIGAVTELCERIMITIALLFIPLTILCCIMSKDLIFIVLQRGKFNLDSLTLTYKPFAIYMFSVFFILVRDFINRVLYGFQDTKSHLIYGLLTLIINSVASFFLVKRLDHIGLAIGTTVSGIVTLPLYLKKMYSYLPGINIKHLIRTVFYICCAVMPLLAISLIVNSAFGTTFEKGIVFTFFKCMIITLVSVLPYVFILRKLSIPEMEDIVIYAKRIFVHKGGGKND